MIILNDKLKKSTLISVCGLSAALTVALLFLGGIAYILSYTVPMFAGILNKMLSKSFGTKCALITFVASSLLSLMLVTDKECVIMYIFCFGYYPIIQHNLGKINSRLIRVIIKLLIWNFLLAVGQLILVYVFGIPFLEAGESKIFILIFALMMNIIFLFYDKLLVRLLFLYEKKFEKHIKRIFK